MIPGCYWPSLCLWLKASCSSGHWQGWKWTYCLVKREGSTTAWSSLAVLRGTFGMPSGSVGMPTAATHTLPCCSTGVLSLPPADMVAASLRLFRSPSAGVGRKRSIWDGFQMLTFLPEPGLGTTTTLPITIPLMKGYKRFSGSLFVQGTLWFSSSASKEKSLWKQLEMSPFHQHTCITTNLLSLRKKFLATLDIGTKLVLSLGFLKKHFLI